MRFYPMLVYSALLGAQSPESVRPRDSMRLAGVMHDARALNGAYDVEVQGSLLLWREREGPRVP
jgi:hypothetical protein